MHPCGKSCLSNYSPKEFSIMIQNISQQKLTEHCSASTELSLCRFVLVRNLLYFSSHPINDSDYSYEVDEYFNEPPSQSVPMEEDVPVLFDEEEWLDACLGDLEEMEDYAEHSYGDPDLNMSFEPEIGFEADLSGPFSPLTYQSSLEDESSFYSAHHLDPPTSPQLDAYFTL
ncbi:hypothetical protein DSO57_1013838 [Entomophthora muscae]|uniref:Uncharacterized protein n=1 Tax=Entomophthora muscae TaxID=34485 RepID=A0ACC2T5Y7_9FUNG|nr:hypothetical protein DSO57_1013838 [Entomophthora muscae]